MGLRAVPQRAQLSTLLTMNKQKLSKILDIHEPFFLLSGFEYFNKDSGFGEQIISYGDPLFHQHLKKGYLSWLNDPRRSATKCSSTHLFEFKSGGLANYTYGKCSAIHTYYAKKIINSKAQSEINKRVSGIMRDKSKIL